MKRIAMAKYMKQIDISDGGRVKGVTLNLKVK